MKNNRWSIVVVIFLMALGIITFWVYRNNSTQLVDGEHFLEAGEVASFSTQSSILGKVQGNFLFTHPAQVYPRQADQVMFTPDGKAVLYVTSIGQKIDAPKALVVNNNVGAVYDHIFSDEMSVSSDSKRVVYAASQGQKGILVTEQLPERQRTEETKFSRVIKPVLSKDDKHLAFSAGIDNHSSVLVIDGKQSSWVDPSGALGDVVFSPDGSRVASVQFLDAQAKESVLRVNDKVLATYEDIQKPIFSPDNQRIAFNARRGSSWFVVVDGKEYGPYGLIGTITFSPDSKTVAWIAYNDSKRSWVFVINGQEQHLAQLSDQNNLIPNSDTSIVFSADGKQVAYIMDKPHPNLLNPDASTNDNLVIVENLVNKSSSVGKVYNWIDSATLTFSPNGEIAYAAKTASTSSIVIGGREGIGKYDFIGRIRFSSKGSLVGYGAKSGNEFQWIVEKGK